MSALRGENLDQSGKRRKQYGNINSRYVVANDSSEWRVVMSINFNCFFYSMLTNSCSIYTHSAYSYPDKRKSSWYCVFFCVHISYRFFFFYRPALNLVVPLFYFLSYRRTARFFSPTAAPLSPPFSANFVFSCVSTIWFPLLVVTHTHTFIFIG